ncbi:MAG: NAD(P) transhydrogenase subunit alpha [Prevotellaceae bacterium]|nr:NAD(P) transhydrogenase subunit alpha [Prevotella sp.]MDD7257452.1 NAD(P) transhydrogenase subunit alpha [Prevotellaceae bacterium]MDY6129830.1 NAD(P) transhydrogenase subunit alpha [Prevotella sp.]
MHPIILVVVFLVCTIAGYFIIKNVPSLLHTPLMSGMNALSGVTIVGAITATGLAFLSMQEGSGTGWTAQSAGCLAIILAAINVFGGFGVTHRMLRMFNKKKDKR